RRVLFRSGTLRVSDGTNAANLILVGTYTGGQFQLASDGASGTLVTDPPAIAGGTSTFDFTDIAVAGAATGTAAPTPNASPAASGAGLGSVDPALQQTIPPFTGSGNAGIT